MKKRNYKVSFNISGNITEIETTNPEVTLRSGYLFLRKRYGVARVTLESDYSRNESTGEYFRNPPRLKLDGSNVVKITRI